jgi:hypothetical protein
MGASVFGGAHRGTPLLDGGAACGQQRRAAHLHRHRDMDPSHPPPCTCPASFTRPHPASLHRQGSVYWAVKGQGAFVQRGEQPPRRLRCADVDLSQPGLTVVGSSCLSRPASQEFVATLRRPRFRQLGSSLKLLMVGAAPLSRFFRSCAPFFGASGRFLPPHRTSCSGACAGRLLRRGRRARLCSRCAEHAPRGWFFQTARCFPGPACRRHEECAPRGCPARGGRLPARLHARCTYAAEPPSPSLAQVAEGTAHIYPRMAACHEWDTAAAHVIVEEAGGAVLQAGLCDGNGRPLEDWKVCVQVYVLFWGEGRRGGSRLPAA